MTAVKDDVTEDAIYHSWSGTCEHDLHNIVLSEF